MRPGERIDLLQRAARRLAQRDRVNANLILREFGFGTDWDEDSSDYEYLLRHLQDKQDDAALVDINEYLRSATAEAPHFEAEDDDSFWRPGEFRLFISHTNPHKARASKLADVLARVGVHAFVAHDSIEPTRQWQDEIEKALRTCDALTALLTTDFVESKWCDQEIGFAVEQRKLVVPLKCGADPHGFIGKYQAIPSNAIGADTTSTYDDAEKLIRALVISPLTAEKAAQIAVNRYARSGSFDAAREGYALIELIPRQYWTPAMVEQIDRANVENNQLTHGVMGDGSGRSIPEATDELLRDVRPVQPVSALAEDDIPF